MTKITGSDGPKIVGQTYRGPLCKNGVSYPDQPYKVLREATLEEWQAQRWPDRRNPEEVRKSALGADYKPLDPDQRFYFHEIATD